MLVTQATYDALRPALRFMLRSLGPEAEGVPIRQLLRLYPEQMHAALDEHLSLYASHREELEAYANSRELTLNAISARIQSSDGASLRAAVEQALNIVFAELAPHGELHEKFLVTQNSLRGALRFAAMLVALCTFLPQVMDPSRISSERADDLNSLLQEVGPDIYKVMSVAEA